MPHADGLTDRPFVLCVDTAQDESALVVRLLRDEYRVVVALDGDRAIAIARSEPPDLILLSAPDPGSVDDDICQRLRADPATRDAPLLLLTSRMSLEDEHRSFEAGVTDYLVRPIHQAILSARVRAYVERGRMAQFLRRQNEFLESRVGERTRAIADMRRALTIGLAAAAEGLTDGGASIERVQRLARIIVTQYAREHPLDAAVQSDRIDEFVDAIAFHDIGMGRVHAQALLKQGALDDADRALVHQHPQASADAIASVSLKLKTPEPMLSLAIDLALAHHEAWDGSGYPAGTRGEAIPLIARVLAVADAYNAMRSDRPYRAALTHSEAIDEVVMGSGSQFDPAIVAAFLCAESQIAAVMDVVPLVAR